jgi:hypothetical protein
MHSFPKSYHEFLVRIDNHREQTLGSRWHVGKASAMHVNMVRRTSRKSHVGESGERTRASDKRATAAAVDASRWRSCSRLADSLAGMIRPGRSVHVAIVRHGLLDENHAKELNHLIRPATIDQLERATHIIHCNTAEQLVGRGPALGSPTVTDKMTAGREPMAHRLGHEQMSINAVLDDLGKDEAICRRPRQVQECLDVLRERMRWPRNSTASSTHHKSL